MKTWNYFKVHLILIVVVVLLVGLFIGCSNGSTGSDDSTGTGLTTCDSCGCGGNTGPGHDCGHDTCTCPVTPPPVDPPKDFAGSDVSLLGYLPPGANVITRMNAKFNLANTDTPPNFYPISAAGDDTSIGGVTFKRAMIYNASPSIGFLFESGNLRIFGLSGTGTLQTITFDVAVIKANGEGWLLQNQDRSFTSMSAIEVPVISISGMTGLNDFTGCNLYIIVRSTSPYIAPPRGPDFNHTTMNTMNVIRVYPNPYSLP